MKKQILVAGAVVALSFEPTPLLQDEFDAPSPLSVAEAQKAVGAAAHEPHVHDHAAAYVCPMHPEVTSATPGKCPKCGMSLVIQKDKP